MILAIDPGPVESALVVYQPGAFSLHHYVKMPNDNILVICGEWPDAERLVIEKIACMGMAVGAEVFETVFWSGRFAQAFGADRCDRITRHAVKINLCGSARAKDANIRQAIIDRFGGPATIKKGGPLYGVSKDVWSALAVALTWCDLKATQSQASLFEEPELAVRG